MQAFPFRGDPAQIAPRSPLRRRPSSAVPSWPVVVARYAGTVVRQDVKGPGGAEALHILPFNPDCGSPAVHCIGPLAARSGRRGGRAIAREKSLPWRLGEPDAAAANECETVTVRGFD